VQGVCDHRGNIIWYSGPHLGVTSDIKLFRDFTPPLEPGERLLGDKAYIGDERLVSQVKRRRGEMDVSLRDRAFNVVHGWYRSTIEHCFAYLKRFRILSGVYRGKLLTQKDYLANALKIIVHISCAYTKHHRQRIHRSFAIQPYVAPRREVNTGVKWTDLHAGMRVKCWWLDDWWAAKIMFISARTKTATVRFVGDTACTPRMKPHLIKIWGKSRSLNIDK
jgi:hypothetical protein